MIVSGKKKTKTATQSMWIEAKTDDGNTYYWNVKTNGMSLVIIRWLFIFWFDFRSIIPESIWTRPKEGYMTLKEYEELNSLAERMNEQQTKQRLNYMNANKVEIGANLVREQFKARHKKHREDEVSQPELVEPQHFSSMDDQAQQVGQWKTVAPKYVPTRNHPIMLIHKKKTQI